MIDTLGGNDFIFGSEGTVGLYEEGELYTRAGNDNLLGFAGSAGIVNGGTTGTIDTGECIDDIVASGSYVGLYSDGTVWAGGVMTALTASESLAMELNIGGHSTRVLVMTPSRQMAEQMGSATTAPSSQAVAMI